MTNEDVDSATQGLTRRVVWERLQMPVVQFQAWNMDNTLATGSKQLTLSAVPYTFQEHPINHEIGE